MKIFHILFILLFSGPARYLPAQGTQAAVEQTVASAVRLLNVFWQANFRRANLNYLPPARIQPYTRPVASPCGPLSLNNAFYCPADRSIWYDAGFLTRLRAEKGDYAVYTVIAHEFGHFISYELRENHRHTIDWELQADCLSGAFIAWLHERSADPDGQFVAAAQTLLRMGDREDTPWFAPRAHGQPAQRVGAFFRGFYRGYSACF